MQEVAARHDRRSVDLDPPAMRMSAITLRALQTLCARAERYTPGDRRIPDFGSPPEWFTPQDFAQGDDDHDHEHEHEDVDVDGDVDVDLNGHTSSLFDAYYPPPVPAYYSSISSTSGIPHPPYPSWANRWGSSIDLPSMSTLEAESSNDRTDRDVDVMRRDLIRRLPRRQYVPPPNRARSTDFRSFTLRRRAAGRAALGNERTATEEILESLYPRHHESTSSGSGSSSHPLPRSIPLRRSFDPVRDAVSRDLAIESQVPLAGDEFLDGPDIRDREGVPTTIMRVHARSPPPLRRGGIRPPEMRGVNRDERWAFDGPLPPRASPPGINYDDVSEPPRPRERGVSPPTSPSAPLA